MIHKVIYSLYPSATYINEEDKAFDAQGNLIELNMTAVNAEVARLQQEYADNEYQRLRAKKYPSIPDQLDTLYHSGLDAWKTQIKTVKDKYPKA
jgi:hypothetical protein